MNFKELSNDQRRQYIDARQTFEAYQSVIAQFRHSYNGSMRWLTRKGRQYLHRKQGIREISLGPRNEETERQYEAFHGGRKQKRDDIKRLEQRLDDMAPVKGFSIRVIYLPPQTQIFDGMFGNA